jgi:hypothetical protein
MPGNSGYFDQDRRASPIERELGYEAVVSGKGSHL